MYIIPLRSSSGEVKGSASTSCQELLNDGSSLRLLGDEKESLTGLLI
jgi:hypothetical protein